MGLVKESARRRRMDEREKSSMVFIREMSVKRGLKKLCYIKETGVTFLSTLGTQYNHTNKQA